jgi:hypothetical protein
MTALKLWFLKKVILSAFNSTNTYYPCKAEVLSPSLEYSISCG